MYTYTSVNYGLSDMGCITSVNYGFSDMGCITIKGTWAQFGKIGQSETGCKTLVLVAYDRKNTLLF